MRHYLPDNVSEADFDRAFPPGCPDECRSTWDNYTQCGGVDQCECYADTIWGFIQAWWYGPCPIEKDPECDCPSQAEIRAERAEMRAHFLEDR